MRDLVRAREDAHQGGRVSRQALRGVSLITAATMIAEMGDLRRFAHPRQLMVALGLVPSEHSSGGKRKQGAITKTPNLTGRRWPPAQVIRGIHAPHPAGALRASKQLSCTFVIQGIHAPHPAGVPNTRPLLTDKYYSSIFSHQTNKGKATWCE